MQYQNLFLGKVLLKAMVFANPPYKENFDPADVLVGVKL